MRGYSRNHHAHIASLEGNESRSAIDLLEKAIKTEHSDEVFIAHHYAYSSLGAEEAREIVTSTENKNAVNERRIFFLSFNNATREAQNTLLKTLEEPALGTSFILVVPSKDILLETIRSRCLDITLELENPRPLSFLTKSYGERLEYIKELLENKELISPFFRALEVEVHEYIHRHNSNEAVAEGLKLPLKYKHAVINNNSSSKYLLEEIAVRLPLIKEL